MTEKNASLRLAESRQINRQFLLYSTAMQINARA